MKEPATPPNEAERLAALAEYDLLDTPSEVTFDDLAELAARVVGVPIALVSIVDANRQWFKARYGLDVPETPRSVSFCGHVVASEQPLVVEDAFEDERFRDNPLVMGDPRVRFYAGMPLRTDDGFVLGTLCTIDHAPRTLSVAQRASLEKLSRQVVSLLELRRKARLLGQERAALRDQRRFFELSVDLLCTIDSALCLRDLNPAWEPTLGFARDSLHGTPLLDRVHEDDRARTRATLAATSSGQITLENRCVHRDGRTLVLAWSLVRVDGLFYAAAHDVTDERAAVQTVLARDRQIAENAAQLRALFDGMYEGVVLQDQHGAILASNPAAAHILGLSEDQLAGRTSLDPRWRAVRENGEPFPGEAHPAMEALRTGEARTGVLMGVHEANGALTWISINARPLRHDDAPPHAVITTFRDVTQERAAAALAAHLTRHERLVTTGTLAAGVGHEINNPLSYVISNVDFVVEELQANGGGSPSSRITDLVEALKQAREGADRVRRIVRGLKSLAREDGPVMAIDLSTAVEAALNIAMHELRRRCLVTIEMEALPQVLADESRVTQVLVNLLINAAQAFRTDDVARNRVVLRGHETDRGIVLEITDNGPGIEAEVLPRIFDPFFTTKPIGQGTGLGLSISHSLVSGLSGELTCETRVGEGTTFRVLLPRASSTEPAQPHTEPRGRVLVVDDEPAVVRSIGRLLQAQHDVTGLADPREALTRLQAGEPFDVVVCDVMMPHLTGVELHRRVRAMRPALADRFVFISGGALREDIVAALDELPNQRLDKPFSTEELRRAVRRELHRR